jgi:NitT/TauT family transport system substrate-binding protein
MRATVVRQLVALALLLGTGVACSPTAAPPAAPPPPAAASAPAAAAPAPAAAAPSSQAPAVPASEPSGLPPQPNRPPARVTIGVLGVASDAVFYLAEEQGYFEHMRIQPVYERFDSGARMVTSLATNQISVGSGSPSVGLYNAIARGVRVKIVSDRASGADNHSTWQMWVRKDLLDSGAIRDYADLRGRRLAVAARGTTAERMIWRALEAGGLTWADVEIAEMAYPDMVVAMSTGSLDVAISPDLFATVAVNRGVASKWRNGRDLVPNQVASVLMYNAEFAEQQRDVARDFMVALVLATREYNDAFEKKLPDALAKLQDVTLRRTDLRDLTLFQLSEATYIPPNGSVDRAAIEVEYEWFRQYGGLTESVDLDQVVDRSFSDYAISVLGPYR